jgi:uncharacterized protein
MGDLSHEQSMEEILSSIKRIIAEDSEAALSPPRAKRAIAPAAAAATSPEPVAEPEVLELTEAAPAEVKATPPVVTTEAKTATISDEAVSASRSSIAALSALVVKPEVTGSDTLEGLVREMVRPMLTEWLDAKLPDIVERLVAQEIRRITDRG